jgi:hypothetical protein
MQKGWMPKFVIASMQQFVFFFHANMCNLILCRSEVGGSNKACYVSQES